MQCLLVMFYESIVMVYNILLLWPVALVISKSIEKVFHCPFHCLCHQLISIFSLQPVSILLWSVLLLSMVIYICLDLWNSNIIATGYHFAVFSILRCMAYLENKLAGKQGQSYQSQHLHSPLSFSALWAQFPQKPNTTNNVGPVPR